MPKEFRVSGSERTYKSRSEAEKTVRMLLDDPPIEERDISEWRLSPPESNVLAELRRLRGLTKQELEKEIVAEITCLDNPYEQDTAILFYLIGKHGTDAVQAAVVEMLGGSLPKDKQ